MKTKDDNMHAHGDLMPKRCDDGGDDAQSVAMTVHVRPDLYRAFMRCVWMLIHEEGLSPLEAQNTLIESFLRHHQC